MLLSSVVLGVLVAPTSLSDGPVDEFAFGIDSGLVVPVVHVGWHHRFDEVWSSRVDFGTLVFVNTLELELDARVLELGPAAHLDLRLGGRYRRLGVDAFYYYDLLAANLGLALVVGEGPFRLGLAVDVGPGFAHQDQGPSWCTPDGVCSDDENRDTVSTYWLRGLMQVDVALSTQWSLVLRAGVSRTEQPYFPELEWMPEGRLGLSVRL